MPVYRAVSEECKVDEVKSEVTVRDQTALLKKSGEHVATIGFNEAYGLWQIVVVQSEEMEFFCPTKEVALASWHDDFDPETGFPRSISTGMPDA